MNSNRYLVEMNFPPFASLPAPAELLSFMEKTALPSFERLEQLEAEGRILAGGTTLGAVGLSFVIRTESAEELDETLAALPLWPRAQTRVVPLGTFAQRAGATRQRLAQLQARLEPRAVPVAEAVAP